MDTKRGLVNQTLVMLGTETMKLPELWPFFCFSLSVNHIYNFKKLITIKYVIKSMNAFPKISTQYGKEINKSLYATRREAWYILLKENLTTA